MKVLVVLLAVVVLLWLLRRQPAPAHAAAGVAAGAAAAAPQAMLACAHCGVHLPRDEALPGRGGVFCGDAHRAAYEKAHPHA